jgi:hypothetical protein
MLKITPLKAEEPPEAGGFAVAPHRGRRPLPEAPPRDVITHAAPSTCPNL